MKKTTFCIITCLGLLISFYYPAKAQYCTGSFGSACNSGDFINNFSTTGGTTNITNNNSGCNGQPNNLMYYAAMTVTQAQGGSFNFSVQSGGMPQGFRIWVDWNNDFDFLDPGEDVWNSGGSGTNAYNGVISIPCSASVGIKRMRIRCTFGGVPTNNACANIAFGETEDYNLSVTAGAAKAITGITINQASVASVSQGIPNNEILRMNISVAGCSGILPLTSLTVNAQNTNNADVSGVKLYATTTATFATTTQLGSTQVFAGGIATFSGLSYDLPLGTSYLWIAYDISASATAGNTVDATIPINGMTINGITYPAAIGNPAGNRPIAGPVISPGGVTTGLNIWLRADIGVTGNTPITAWTNQCLTGPVVLVNGAPNKNNVATTYNYNPYIDFIAPVGVLANGLHPSRQFLYLQGYSGLTGINYKALFYAFQLNDLSRVNTHVATVENITTGFASTLHGTNIGGVAGIQENGYNSNDFGNASPAGTWQRNSVNITSNSVHTINKQILSANATTAGTVTLNTFLGGQRDGSSGGFIGHFRDWRGPVGEVIAYTSTLSAVDRQKIHSYLAIKYGVTLTSNYLNTLGNIVFTTTAPYNNNIIGLGRDDTEALTQKQSHNNDDSVRVFISTIMPTNIANTGAFTLDRSYIITGANTGKLNQTASVVAELPATLCHRIEREWKVTRTNNSQNFNFDIKPSASINAAFLNPANLVLLVDDDGNFTNATIFNPTFAVNSGVISITGINTTMIPDNASRYITIAILNNITVDASADHAICSGASYIIPATQTNGTIFTWSPATGLSSTSVLQPTANPSATTTYTLTVSNGLCNKTDNIVITINPNPVLTPTATPTAICVGASSNLSTTSTITGTTYNWMPGSLSGSPVSVSPTATTTYTVTGTASGCSGSATVSVTINPNPVLTPTATPDTICEGQSSSLSVTSSLTGTTYNWMPGSLSGSPVSVSPTATTTYTVTGTTLGCTGSTTVSVTVNPNPVVSPSASPAAICIGDSSDLSATSSIIGTIFTWLPGNLNGNPVTVNPTTATTYTVTGNVSGCTGSATVSVSINPNPVVTPSAVPQTICIGSSTSLTASSNVAGTTFDWMPGSLIGSPVSVSPVANSTYTVTGTALGCTGSATLSITVNPNPVITTSVMPATVCAGGTVSLSVSSDLAGTTFSWTPGNLTGTPVSVSPQLTTTYSVTGTAQGCTGTEIALVTISPSPDVNILSNPKTGCNPLMIDFQFNVAASLTDSTWTWDFGDIGTPDNHVIALDTSHTYMHPGTYYVSFVGTTIGNCTVLGFDTIVVTPTPTADFYFSPDYAFSDNPTIYFKDQSGYPTTHHWDFGDYNSNDNFSNLVNPIHVYSDTGNYTIQLIVTNGICSDTAIKNVNIYLDETVFIPNAFTPNEDGKNDIFLPIVTGIDKSDYLFIIYDRWGKVAFETNDTQKGWDGKINGKYASLGVYTYKLLYREFMGVARQIKGIVTLIK